MAMTWGCVGLVALMLPCLIPAASVNWHRVGDSLSSVLRFHPRHEQPASVVARPETDETVTYGQPAFCNGLDCPEYTLIKNEPTYQLREYKVSHWFSTTSVGVDYERASHDDFMRLFHYIDGQNEKKEKINMTAPVLMRIIPGPGAACADTFTMSFFNSPKVTNPPQPSNKDIFFSTLKKIRVYVRSFPGFAMTVDKWLEEARQLAEDLKGKGDYVKDYYYTAGYNSPFQLTGRHNEIWFLAK